MISHLDKKWKYCWWILMRLVISKETGGDIKKFTKHFGKDKDIKFNQTISNSKFFYSTINDKLSDSVKKKMVKLYVNKELSGWL